jgi:hypothetical protein
VISSRWVSRNFMGALLVEVHHHLSGAGVDRIREGNLAAV